jgi:hypothetical protein
MGEERLAGGPRAREQSRAVSSDLQYVGTYIIKAGPLTADTMVTTQFDEETAR